MVTNINCIFVKTKNLNTMFKDKKKGDTCYYRSSPYNNTKTECEMLITKVSGEFIYCSNEISHNYKTKHKFNIVDGLEIVNIGGSGTLYPSKQYYLDIISKRNLVWDIKTLLDNNMASVTFLEGVKNHLINLQLC